MPARADENEPVLAVRQNFEPFRPHVAGDDSDIRHAVGDGAHDVGAQALAQVDVDIAMAGEKAREHAGRNSVIAVVLAKRRT